MIKWEIRTQDENSVKALENAGYDGVLARLLVNRGCKLPSDADAFCNPEKTELFSPALLPDIEAAAEKIRRAISENKRITVYGDYDVDGVTSVSALMTYLRQEGADADFYIPDRKDEGYGLSVGAIDRIADKKTSLIITVDTGTTAVEEVEYIKSLGMDVVVTDHHECSAALPDCPVVNPKRPDSRYPFEGLAGVGVVFKLISYLSGENEKTLFSEYGIFAAIGTVADIMPLTGENRRIVYEGIKLFSQYAPMGLKILAAKAGCEKPDSGSVAFRLAPRLNAVGRMGSAFVSAELLLTDDVKTAEKDAETLCLANEERQQTEKRIFAEVEKRLQTSEKHNIIIEGSENWHSGVIGIVASRLAEKYRRPAVLFCFENNAAKGSARSVAGVSIYGTISAAAEFCSRFGGHDMAAGLTVPLEKFEDFRRFLYDYADKNISASLLEKTVSTECLLPHDRLSLDFCGLLKCLEPFGATNPDPVFTVKNLEAVRIEGVSFNKHSRILFRKEDGETFFAMFFSRPPESLFICPGDRVDIACGISENIFRGNSSLSVTVRAVFPSEGFEREIFGGKEEYVSLVSKNGQSDLKITKDDVSAVYLFLRQTAKESGSLLSPAGASRRLKVKGKSIGYIKFRLCLDVLKELSLIEYTENESGAETLFEISVVSVKEKTSLEKSEIYKKYSE